MSDESTPVALFDLDGTLADYEGAMRRGLIEIAGPNDDPDYRDPTVPLFPSDYDKEPNNHKHPSSHIRRRMDCIKRQPGWWEDLPVLDLGMGIYRIACEMGFERHVLTKGPKNTTGAWTEKVHWCQKNLPDDNKITITQDKGLVYGKLLVDDYPPYILSWLKWRPRGLVIMPAATSNKGFAHDNVIRYDGTNLDVVSAVMKIAHHRNPGDPLAMKVSSS